MIYQSPSLKIIFLSKTCFTLGRLSTIIIEGLYVLSYYPLLHLRRCLNHYLIYYIVTFRDLMVSLLMMTSVFPNFGG